MALTYSIIMCAKRHCRSLPEHSFEIVSHDRTFWLVADSQLHRDEWIASIEQQFTHDWRQVVSGKPVPEGCVYSAAQDGKNACVARNAQGDIALWSGQ